MNRDGSLLIKRTLIYAIGSFGPKLLAFIIVPFYSYYINPSDMGEYDLLLTTVNLISPFVCLRFAEAAYRWMLHKHDQKDECIKTTYQVIITTSLLAITTIYMINAFFSIKYVNYFSMLLIGGVWLEAFQMLIRGLDRKVLYAISGLIFSTLFLFLNVIKIAILHEGVEALFQSTIISQIITIAVIYTFTSELRIFFPITRPNYNLLIEMLKYSLPLIPAGLCWWTISFSDRYIINAVLGNASVGIYAIANKFPTIISTLFVIFNYSWTDTVIGDLKTRQETSKYASFFFRDVYSLSFTFLLFLVPFTKLVCNYILSDTYASSSLYIGFLYLGAVFQGMTAFVGASILQQNKTLAIVKSNAAGAIVNILVDLLTIHWLGLFAASISTFIGGFIMWLIRMAELKQISPITIEKPRFMLLLLLTIIMCIVTIWTGILVDLVLSFFAAFFFIAVNKSTLVSMLKRNHVLNHL